MKKYSILFILMMLVGCSGYSPPTATPPPALVRTVMGDLLPEEFPSYPAVDLFQPQNWQEIDALLISKDLLYKAKDDPNLQQQLQSVAWQTIILISGATPQDAAEILQLHSPTTTTPTNKYVFVAVRATNSHTLGGGLAVPKDRKTPIDISADINRYIRSVQEEFATQEAAP